MDFAAVQAQLNDLPSTFQRYGAPYTQVIDAQSSALTLFTGAVDSVVQQLSFPYAMDGWLDTWGLLFGVPRNTNEGNAPYATRILETAQAWVGTVPAVQTWLNLFAAGGVIAENLPGVGYVITFPAGMTSTQIAAFLASLNRIRPAGVPFRILGGTGGLYLDTVNFFDEGRMPGSYLSDSAIGPPWPFGASTNNATPLLPDLYLTDPTLNPGGAP